MITFKRAFLLASAMGAVAVYGCVPDYSELTHGATTSAGRSGSGGASGVGGAGHAGRPAGGSDAESGGTGTAGEANGTAGLDGTSGNGGNDAAGGAMNVSGATNQGGATDVAGANNIGGSDPGVPCPLAGNSAQFAAGALASAPRLIQDDFTIEVWLKIASSPSGTYFWQGGPIAWADVSTNTSPDFGFSVLNGHAEFNVGGPDTGISAVSNIATNQWVHVAVTRTKLTGAVEIFVNGLRDGIGTASTSSLNASPVISIGSATAAPVLDGAIDEVRLWEVVRSQAEILASMHKPLTGNETGLVGYYRFDNVIGSVLQDSSRAANNGTISGSPILAPSNAPICESQGGSGGAAGGAGAPAGGAGGAGGAATAGSMGGGGAPTGGAGGASATGGTGASGGPSTAGRAGTAGTG